MAFSWIGLKNYVDWADEKQAEEIKKQDEREALAFSLAAKYGVDFLGDGLGTTLAGASGTTSGFDQASKSSYGLDLKTLQAENRYNLSDEVLAPIIASGDKTAPSKLLKLLDEQRLKYKKIGQDLPQERVNEILESAVVQLPTTRKLDFTKIEEYIGRPLDDLYKKVLEQSAVTAGGVTLEDPGFFEKPDITEIGQIPKVVAMWQKDGARKEESLLLKRLGQLKDLPDDQVTDATRNETNLLQQRLNKVQSAMENFSEDPSELISLYGNSFALELLKEYPQYEGLVPESISDASKARPLVSSEAMAAVLLQTGIISEGTIVRLPDGREFAVRFREQ